MISFDDPSVQRTCDRLTLIELPERYDLVSHIQLDKMPFSKRAFGPGRRTKGISEHIEQELLEIKEDPLDVEEWIDIAHLALDGAWRCLKGRVPDEQIGALVAAVFEGKQRRNEQRQWPNWEDHSEDEAINHAAEQPAILS